MPRSFEARRGPIKRELAPARGRPGAQTRGGPARCGIPRSVRALGLWTITSTSFSAIFARSSSCLSEDGNPELEAEFVGTQSITVAA